MVHRNQYVKSSVHDTQFVYLLTWSAIRPRSAETDPDVVSVKGSLKNVPVVK